MKRHPMRWLQRSSRHSRGIHVGSDVDDGARIEIDPKWLRTGVLVVGPTGSGKSRLLHHTLAQLTPDPNAATVVLSGKGSFGREVRDLCVARGLTRRVVVADPGEQEHIVGFSPIRPSNVDPAIQVKAAREAIRSAWGQQSFSATPQLARYLTLCLTVARAAHLTLTEAVEILRPDSSLRAALIPTLSDPYTRRALESLDGLREARIDELTASCLARLEAFVADPWLRNIVTQSERSLDLGEIIAERKILIVDLRIGDPLRKEDVALVGKLLLGALITEVFARPEGKRHPVNLVIDEAALFCTPDLCVALDQGRELGLRTVLACQFPEQFVAEDESTRMLKSVLNDARTRILFGGLWIEDLEPLVRDMFIDQINPRRVLDELTGLECEPVEERRQSTTVSKSWGTNRQAGTTRSETIQKSQTEGTTHTTGESEARAVGKTLARGSIETHSSSSSDTTTEGSSSLEMEGEGLAVMTPGDPDAFASSTVIANTGAAFGRMSATTHTDSSGYAFSSSEAEADTWTKSSGESRSRAVKRDLTNGHASSLAQSEQAGSNEGGSISVQDSPFTAYRTRRVVTSRTFMSEDQQLTEFLQKVKAQPVGHFVVKVPDKPAVFVRAPLVKMPTLTSRGARAAREKILSQPYYSRPEEIAAEEEARAARLLPAPAVKPATRARGARKTRAGWV